jgi:hypothetical protein
MALHGRFSPLGDEIHPWMPNGDFRPTAAIGAQILQRLLSVK